jgi:hypothetical protein
MPNLYGAGDGENPEQQAGNELDRNSRDEELLAVESIGNSTGKQAEDYERKSLEKASEPELKGRTRNFIHLIQTGDITYLNRYGIKDTGQPYQAIIPNQQGRPRANIARGRLHLYFG